LGQPPFKIGIVGCGKIAGRMDRPKGDKFIGTHALAYHKHPRFTLEVAVNPTLEHLQSFQKTWKIPRGYISLPGMLDGESLDVISLCSPNEHHAAQLRQILESPHCPRVIFVEKPVCLDRSELEEVKNLLPARECLVIVNHSRRFDPGHIRLRQYIESGELGYLLQGRCDYYGGWLNNGCHVIDTLRMLFQKSLVVESAQEGPPGKFNDPCLNVKLRVGDAPVDVTGFDDKYYQLYESEFRFEHGRVILKEFGAQIFVERVEINNIGERVLTPLPDSPWKGLDSPMYHAISIISEYLDKGTIPAGRGILFDEAVDTMDVLWTAVEYLKRGQKG